MEICPAGLGVLGVSESEKRQPCPLLRWQGVESRCALILAGAKGMGDGEGCCIKATVIHKGEARDFAALSEKEKVVLTQQFIRG